jgi:acyl carrier protein
VLTDRSETVRRLVLELAREQGSTLASAQDHHTLVEDLGLSSLDFATLVATLEIELDMTPFAEDFAITDMRRVGDLCRAFSGAEPEQAPTPRAARASGWARRPDRGVDQDR